MRTCRFCSKGTLHQKLDLGQQPIGNRFLKTPDEKGFTFSFTVGTCEACSLIQLINAPPVSEIVPRFPWIQYNEPEAHLDSLWEDVSKISSISKTSLILGLTSKDDTFLERFKKHGYINVHRIDPKKDLGIKDACAGIESIPEQLTAHVVEKIKKRYGDPALLVARHVFEHAQESHMFIGALKRLVGKGILLLEVPDCSKSFERKDYTTLWEEHIIYFSPDTFPSNFSLYGGNVLFSNTYEYPFENSLVALFTFDSNTAKITSPSKRMTENSRTFFESFSQQKKEIQEAFQKLVIQKGKVAMLGAGHLSTAFINFFDLKDHVALVVDDFQPKHGLYMPGTNIPIGPSSKLMESAVMSCLIGVGVGNEQKILDRNHAFLSKGGSFYSIFPGRKNSFYGAH